MKALEDYVVILILFVTFNLCMTIIIRTSNLPWRCALIDTLNKYVYLHVVSKCAVPTSMLVTQFTRSIPRSFLSRSSSPRVRTLYTTSPSIDHAGSFCVHENTRSDRRGVERIGWRCPEQTRDSAGGELAQEVVPRYGLNGKNRKKIVSCGREKNMRIFCQWPVDQYGSWDSPFLLLQFLWTVNRRVRLLCAGRIVVDLDQDDTA